MKKKIVKGYGNCKDCVWYKQPEGCNVEYGSKVCLLNKKIKNYEK
jgi:hypothetical protein